MYRVMDFTDVAHAVEVDHGIQRLPTRFLKRYAAPERQRLSTEPHEEARRDSTSSGSSRCPGGCPRPRTRSCP